jgi:glycosyltransferase involved in cell wall biosynthesis
VPPRLRIVQVTKAFYPGPPGGVEIHTSELIKALAPQHEVAVFTKSTALVGDSEIDGVRVRAVPETDPGEDDPGRSVAAFAELLAAVRPDVVHYQYLGANGLAVARRLSHAVRRRGTPSVLSLHDYWYACPRHTLFDWQESACAGPASRRCGRCMGWDTRNPVRWLRRGWEQRTRRHAFLDLARRSGILVAVSEHVRRRYESLGFPAEQMMVIRPGLSLPTAPPPPARADGPLQVAFLGRLVPEKGVHVLLAALRSVRAPCAVDLWGPIGPEYEARLRRLIAGGPHPVRFRGLYDHGELDAVLAPVHVVVVPSLWEEAFGLVVQEALARRRVVIASRTGGLVEQIRDGENGYLVAPGDAAGLAAALDAVATARPGTSLHGDAGVRSIAEEAEEWGRLYARLAARNRDDPAVIATRRGA